MVSNLQKPTSRKRLEARGKPHEGNDVWLWDNDRGQHSGLGLRMRRGARGTSAAGPHAGT
jgi:hypothetical protein